MYADQTIEMNDFCLRFKIMPKNKFFDGEFEILKAKLYDQMQKLIIDETGEEDEAIFETNLYQITDIDFADRNLEKTFLLAKLKTLEEKIFHEKEEIRLSGKKKKCKDCWCCNKQRKYNNVLKQYKKLTTKEKESPKPNSRPYAYAYITFRSMDGFELIENSYKKYSNTHKRRFYKFCSCIYKKQAREIALREIDGEWPYPSRARQPDNILWKNMGTGRLNQIIRSLITILIAIFVTALAFVGIIYFNLISKNLNDNFKIIDTCPSELTKLEAIQDIQK